jgi:hypothetical protein
MSPAPWKWDTSKGSRKLVGADGSIVLEARASRFKPPSIYVGADDALAIEAVPEMVALLISAEIALRLSNITVSADRIKDLLARIKA